MEVEVDFAPKAVFLAGERLTCTIHFRVPPRSRSPSPSPTEFLAWSSVQLQCEVVMESNASVGEVVKIQQNGRTSLRPSDWSEGRQIVSSKPKVLFCELSLQAGQAQSFAYSDRIPSEAPPTYRGRNIKFAYHLLIGTQRPNAPVQLVKVPVRVLASPYPVVAPEEPPPPRPSVGLSSALAALQSPDPGQNPFLIAPDATPSEDSEANQVRKSMMSQSHHHFHRKLTYYNISNSQGRIAELCLVKRDFKLGEEIVGVFNFAVGHVACLQYSARLLCQEEILGAPDRVDFTRTSDIPHGRYHEFCLGFSECGLSLEVPLNATPTFNSNVCNISWRIHFEFVLSMDESVTRAPDRELVEWNGPQKVNVQTLAWDLPIVIHPSEALHFIFDPPEYT
ncbi:hypothetical protein TCAL_07049 [Tigriopus californicus]|uniref:Rgp1 n=1 Tax=Tigriopus californicus TaxID=6832 RepID=A0A553PQN2_TIGCA|nr:hypothetical protein TCAL_07049 [Tigriopus californicus]|eukprot:TCALIF_07049-PA protein Name:"Similar to Rgp1 Retrograde Golgi transport protein RGP1 homolog (Mus musculus)" AED:0.02 eAED:0.02 QI:0/0/0/0.5/1/1/2/0/392